MYLPSCLFVLQPFKAWLESQPEFEYIVDGPNVAYASQNEDGGRFAYAQVLTAQHSSVCRMS